MDENLSFLKLILSTDRGVGGFSIVGLSGDKLPTKVYAFVHLDCVHTMPAHFEKDRKSDSKKTLHDFDAKEMYLHSMNPSVSFQQRREMFCFHHFRVFTRCSFKKCAGYIFVFKIYRFQICRQKMCRFRVNGMPIRHIFYRFQNVPASW